MKELFKEIMNIEDVEGVLVFSFDNMLVYHSFSTDVSPDFENFDWSSFLELSASIREADIIFENKRVYFRKGLSSYVIVIMGLFAPVAMVRLNCDILLPSLKPEIASKGIGRLFKRKK